LEAKIRGSSLGLLIQFGAKTSERFVISMLVICDGRREGDVNHEEEEEEEKEKGQT
jgi:hypothetical protein